MMKKLFSLMLIILLVTLLFSGCLEDSTPKNKAPIVEIDYPMDNATVASIVKITGTATDPDDDADVETVEIKINGSDWETVEGTTEWSYDWNTYKHQDGLTPLSVRAFDGNTYSELVQIRVNIHNPEIDESEAHKWAVFVIAANYPEKNETKLGNGGLYLAEDMASYFVDQYDFSTSNVFILFDDGWIREDNGYGKRIETLQQRPHKYDFHYGGATEANVETVLRHVVEEANDYTDSEVFFWFAGHGSGDTDNPITGGKILKRSALYLWDELLTDRELGDMLYSLRADKTTVIVDACFSGGFAQRTIADFPTFFLLNSRIPGSGRVVISGASKFRSGFASTTRGPLFTLLWYEGLTSGKADGFRPGIRSVGKPPVLGLIKNGRVSVEEAFYYARYVLRNDETFDEYESMEPQINDQYPHRGILRNNGELEL